MSTPITIIAMPKQVIRNIHQQATNAVRNQVDYALWGQATTAVRIQMTDALREDLSA